MKSISRKGEIQEELQVCMDRYQSQGLSALYTDFDTRILQAKVKFPLLEYCATELFRVINSQEQLAFCDRISAGKSEGGNVILGILLQKRLPLYFKESVQKTCEYIAAGKTWYVSDIIGERVWGYSLLQEPDKLLKEMKELAQHENHWVVRSIGAGAHNAIKKGLSSDKVEELFELLLSLANAKNPEIRRGIGWAAKTTAKFHPSLISSFREEISNEEKVAHWFRKKVALGLKRNAYAKGNRG